MTPNRKRFTDTITSLEAAQELAPDDTGERRPPTGPTYVSFERYQKDMKDVIEGLRLLKQFQDRTSWSLKLLAILFSGACAIATTAAVVVGAFRHG